jgi:ankyrin repeat domain-containing protein 50
VKGASSGSIPGIFAMSADVVNAVRLKADLRLMQAISEFQKDLPMDQKVRFFAYQTQSQKSPPNINDVMRLTAELDRDRLNGGRCLGPRFTNFLQGVQQFAALGDVIVGGSQNVTACAVWSLVRLSLQVGFPPSTQLI